MKTVKISSNPYLLYGWMKSICVSLKRFQNVDLFYFKNTHQAIREVECCCSEFEEISTILCNKMTSPQNDSHYSTKLTLYYQSHSKDYGYV